MTRRLLISALILLSCFAVGPSAVASPEDELTEAGERFERTVTATQYSDVQGTCEVRRNRPRVTVICDRGEYVGFDYNLAVHKDSLNLRVAPLSYTKRGTTGRSYAYAEGYRLRDRRYVLQVGFSGPGRFTFREASMSYRVPDEYDFRNCVTVGEWARINPSLGGTAGSAPEIAAIFDTRGTRARLSRKFDGFQYQIRAYKRCNTSRTFRVLFHRYDSDPQWWSYWG